MNGRSETSVTGGSRPTVRLSDSPPDNLPHCRQAIRILFLADTHLGFDLPVRPRVERRRRGLDFMANFERVLETAVSEQVDCVVHGGDLFYRSRIPASLVQRVFLPMKRVADAGIPFFVVPGNHERSRIPYDMLALHPRIHIFDRPRTFVEKISGLTVAFAGFPYWRNEVRSEFPQVLEATNWQSERADVNLLCVHHCFEGATVGTHNYMFRYGRDVVQVNDVPAQFAAVLTGHVHRSQVLRHDLRGRPLSTPVIYPGSIERTSFAEKDETKGYFVLEVMSGSSAGGVLRDCAFRPLPARPMIVEELDTEGASLDDLEKMMRRALRQGPEDAVVQLRIRGRVLPDARPALSAPRVRSLASAAMNVEVVIVDERKTR
jgi:exonuclease SbcD